jgi:plastocyanin
VGYNVSMRRALVLLLVLTAAFAACSSNNKVGSNKVLDFQEKKSNLNASATPAPTKAAVATPVPRAVATPVKQAPVRTAPPQVQYYDIAINGAQASSAFDPADANVKRGTVVRWVNRDSQARSVVADGGAFKSPSIPPGGSWSYTASKAGTFSYHDGTRPYAVARLVVS